MEKIDIQKQLFTSQRISCFSVIPFLKCPCAAPLSRPEACSFIASNELA